MRFLKVPGRRMWPFFLLALIIGGFVRTLTSHGDPGAVTNYLVMVVPVMLPAIIASMNSARAADHAEDAANNTNGKLDIRFAQMTKQIRELVRQFDRHLRYHSDHDDDGSMP